MRKRRVSRSLLHVMCLRAVKACRRFQKRRRFQIALSLGFGLGMAVEFFMPGHESLVKVGSTAMNLMWLWLL